MSENRRPVQMIRACSPGLDVGRLHSTVRLVRGVRVFAPSGKNVCPTHDNAVATGPRGDCLDNFWSQQHLARLSLVEAWRLWRSWRREARR